MVNRKKSRGKLQHSEELSLPLFSIDDDLNSVPAAGYRNGTSLNNAGSNGNYWSATPNESNSNNAYNLNFNSSEQNVNWNNRNNGHSVRPVAELTPQSFINKPLRHFAISKEQLLEDLFKAYRAARKNKRNRAYQLKFEFNLEEKLVALRDELYNATYSPLPSTCFIIHEPKMREVFAANFRDRIVHHLFYNYTHELFERTFIYDSYSCIKYKGTHFGIKRLKHHIQSISAGYSRPCYILKIDIRGYFMNINRRILLKLCRSTLDKMKTHSSNVSGKSWGEVLDYSLLDYLLDVIINSDPIQRCHVLGKVEDWNSLPLGKSLFHAAAECGLPIGNLSSQLFSNVYLNVLDQYVKRTLRCKHYGRYVDDAYVVSGDREFLKSLIPQITDFLRAELGLEVNPDKVKIFDIRHGVEFLGAFLKPHRTYVSSSSYKRIKRRVMRLSPDGRHCLQSAVNSYLGVLSHYKSYRLRRVLFGYQSGLAKYGRFNRNWQTFICNRHN